MRKLLGSNRPACRLSRPWFVLEPLEPRVLPSASPFLPAGLLETNALGGHAIVAQNWDRTLAQSEAAHRNSHPAPVPAPAITRTLPAITPSRSGQDIVGKGNVLETSEAGGQASFSIVLDSQPLADVTIPIPVSDPSEGAVSAAELVFTPDNWDKPQTVTVTGVDDDELDGDIPYIVAIGPAVSEDPTYDGLDAADVEVINLDNDTGPPDLTPTTVTLAPVGLPGFPVETSQGPPGAPNFALGPPVFSSNQGIASSNDFVGAIVPQPSPPSAWDSMLGDLTPGGAVGESAPAGAVEAELGSAASDAESASEHVDPSLVDDAVGPEQTDVSYVAQPADATPPTTSTEPATPLGIVSDSTQLASLNLLAQQFDQAGRSWSTSETVAVSTVTGTTVVFSVGYLLWAVRGGSLLTSVLCVTPAWRLVDPIPVLEFARRKADRRDPKQQEGSGDDDYQADILFQ